MNLLGEKVLLRAIEPSDKDVLLNIINDSDTEYNIAGWSFPISNQQQEEWIRALKPSINILRCMIVDKESNMPLGTVILSDIDYKNGNGEIHIKLSQDIRGRGYGTDAVKTVVKYAFNELRLKCIYAYVNSYNEASKRLFEKCGFKIDGVLRSRIFKKGSYHDVVALSIINEE